MSGTGEEWVTLLVGNLRFVLFFAGMLMMIVTPFYFIRCLRRRGSGFEDLGKGFILGMFGVAFFLAGLLWNT
jgi:hypothetical protein